MIGPLLQQCWTCSRQALNKHSKTVLAKMQFTRVCQEEDFTLPGDDGQDEAEGEEDTKEDEPRTKEEFDRFRKNFKNSRDCACHFYHQRSLQREMRVLYLGAHHLHAEFQEALEKNKEGQAPSQ